MADQTGPHAKEPAPEISKKLDGDLRRLLRMSDGEILEAVDRERDRLVGKKAAIERSLAMNQTMASAQDRDAVRRLRRSRVRALAEAPLISAVIADRFAPTPVRIRAMVEFRGNRDDLLAMGLEVRSQAHDVFTVVGTTEQLADLAAQPATRRVELPKPARKLLYNATGQAEIDQVRVPRAENPAGYTGRDVILGVIDTPLDVTHHAFQDPEGSHGTRVRWMWVQTPSILNADGDPEEVDIPDGQLTPEQFHQADPDNTPDFAGLDYGIVYTEDAIIGALDLASRYGTGANQICCTPEPEEHGTRVAGIAAGNGHVDDWDGYAMNIGAAPDSIIVHVSNRSHSDDNIMDALAFIFAVADFHGLPVVVNISLGSAYGPHMGTRPKDRFIDHRLNSYAERVVVLPTGNDSNDSGFREGIVPADGTDSFTLTPASTTGENVALELWYAGPDLAVRIGFTSGDEPVFSPWQEAGEEYASDDLAGYAVWITRQWDEDAGLGGIRISVQDAVDTAPLTVELRTTPESGDIQYFGWVCSGAEYGTVSGATEDRLTLTGDSCCYSVLSVGACSKRPLPAPAAGEYITYYSGAGPTLDGRVKPEIVAVGGIAMGGVMTPTSDGASGYSDAHGTSMSSPLVAGAVALLFEEARLPELGFTLNHDTVKALLINHTNRLGLNLDPEEDDYDPSDRNSYGHGRLRMIGPIDHLRPPVNVDLWVRTADDDYGEQQFIGDCFCGSPDIRVFETGSDVETTELTWDETYDVRVTLRNLGDDDAVDAKVYLKYTLPWTAPNEWEPAQDDHDAVVQDEHVLVPALGETTVTFRWRPQRGEIEDAPADETHFCLLAEVDHIGDELAHPAPTEGGTGAWATNIKGTNNVALRNVHIQ